MQHFTQFDVTYIEFEQLSHSPAVFDFPLSPHVVLGGNPLPVDVEKLCVAGTQSIKTFSIFAREIDPTPLLSLKHLRTLCTGDDGGFSVLPIFPRVHTFEWFRGQCQDLVEKGYLRCFPALRRFIFTTILPMTDNLRDMLRDLLSPHIEFELHVIYKLEQTNLLASLSPWMLPHVTEIDHMFGYTLPDMAAHMLRRHSSFIGMRSYRKSKKE